MIETLDLFCEDFSRPPVSKTVDTLFVVVTVMDRWSDATPSPALLS